MSGFSPMMRRIRDNKSLKFKIPKKGRIRFLFILLLFGAAFKYGGALLVSGAQDSASKASNIEQKNQSPEKKASPSAVSKKDHLMSFSDMATILKKSSAGML